jgi:hypothetical protein
VIKETGDISVFYTTLSVRDSEFGSVVQAIFQTQQVYILLYW